MIKRILNGTTTQSDVIGFFVSLAICFALGGIAVKLLGG